MLRSRLKNIINRQKELSKKLEVGNPFDEFKKSLPIEVDNNYRLEAAWKAYGKPKDYKEAIWQGLIQPIDENNIKLPSIGYDEESDTYEYLNSGRENDIVSKDIRVWDNDVIPFVKELKLGGFIRTFDEEKNCWTYSKLKNLENVESFKSGGKKKVKIYLEGDSKEGEYIEVESLDEDLRAGRKPIGKDSKGRNRYLNGDNKAVLNQGGRLNGDVPGFLKGGKPKLESQNIPRKMELSEIKDKTSFMGYLHTNGFDVSKYDYDAIWDNEEARNEFILKLLDIDLGLLKFKNGGQMNVIPEVFKLGGAVIPSGSLHAHKNHMELASEGIVTPKGIPVISEEKGEVQLQAEIEREEVIFDKLATTDIENLYKKFNEADKLSEKDEIAIKAGKILTDIFINNTEDNTGLILKILEKM